MLADSWPRGRWQCQVCALLAVLCTAAAKEKSSAATCNTCQSVAHLLVKARKELTSGHDKKSASEAAAELFKEREKYICHEEKLQSYAEKLNLKPATMVKKCKAIVPEKFEYKSAQDLKKMLIEKKPRSDVSQLLCADSGRCEKLWDKEEEPWRSFGKKGEL